MAILSWDESYSTKIEMIDDQHKKLFELINDFYNNIANGATSESILKLIDGMKRYTVLHFSTEERYMKQLCYPDFQEHKKEHDDFVSKVYALESKIKNGTTIISFEITNFLRSWIKNHINNTDKKYTEFFLEKGLR